MLKQERGFSLLELLLACGLGLIIAGAALQSLLSEQQLGIRLGAQLRQRQLLLRANQLIAADIARGMAITDELPPVCKLAGRRLWMQIVSTDGAVTSYSLGDPPSPIWTGQVLMRCGPAFDLQGRSRASSTYQNRVVLDAIDTIKLHQPVGLPVIEMELEQLLNGGGNNDSPKTVRSTAVG